MDSNVLPMTTAMLLSSSDLDFGVGRRKGDLFFMVE